MIKMEWTPINERMPETPGQYLVSNGATILICSLSKDGTFFGIGFPTHWMNLPELPSKTNNMGEFTITSYDSMVDIVDIFKEQLASYGLEIVNVSDNEEGAIYKIQPIK